MLSFFTDLMAILVITLVLTALFAVGIRRRKAPPVVFSFFVILFLATWAVGVWIRPAPAGGRPWLSFLLVGFLFALLLTVLVPLARYAKGRGTTEAEEKEVGIVAFDLFFWVLVVGLIAAIVVDYVPIPF